MKIIIAADLPLDPAAESVMTPEPVVQPQPEPVQPQAPQPSPVPKAKAPKPKQNQDQLNNFYDKIDAIHRKFKETNDMSLIEVAANEINPEGRSLIQYLGGLYYFKASRRNVNLTPEDAEAAAYRALMSAFRAAAPGRIVKYIMQNLHNEMSEDRDLTSQQSSLRSDIRYRQLKDYLRWLARPELREYSGEPGQIDNDIMAKINKPDENGEIFTQAHAANEMYRRNKFKDHPVEGDPHGRRRVEFAFDSFVDYYNQVFQSEKSHWEQQLAAMTPEQRAVFARKEFKFRDRWDLLNVDPPHIAPKINTEVDLSARMKELKAQGGDLSVFKPPAQGADNPYWLSPEMMKRRDSKDLADLWARISNDVAGRQSVSIDDSNTGLQHISDEAKKPHPLQTVVDSPNNVLESIYNSILENKDAPMTNENRQLIKNRLNTILPFIDGPAGKAKKNPNFKKTFEYILEKLYGPTSKPMFKNRVTDDVTKYVLHEIGKDLASKFTKADALENRFRNTELEEAIQEYLPNIGVRHVAKDMVDTIDPEESEQMQSVAMGELMMDILNFIRDNKNYQEIMNLAGGHKAVAELKAFVRTANFLVNSRIIALRR